MGYIPYHLSIFLARNCGFLAARVAKHPPWPSAGGSPWPGRRLGAFAQRRLAHCTYWDTCRELFGLFRAKRAILSLHAGVALAGGAAENQLDTGRFAMKGMASTRA